MGIIKKLSTGSICMGLRFKLHWQVTIPEGLCTQRQYHNIDCTKTSTVEIYRWWAEGLASSLLWIMVLP